MPDARATDRPAEASGRVVCLGEVLIDFVADVPVQELSEARAFQPRFGGSVANISVGAARFGARAEMLGGAGGDAWGRFQRDTLAGEEVDTSRFELLPGVPTPHTFVAVSEDGEPSYAFFGEGRERIMDTVAAHLDDALAGPPGVFVYGSDTLNGAGERQVTLGARDLARERGWLLLYDPNLRPIRWEDEGRLRAVALDAARGASVLKANVGEVLALTGARELEDALEILLALDLAAVVVTRGGEGIVVVVEGGEPPLDVPAAPARMLDATGAGDSVAGVVAAALARTGDPRSVLRAAPVAAETAARVTESYGAIAGLPPAEEARRSLAEALAGG